MSAVTSAERGEGSLGGASKGQHANRIFSVS